MLAVSIVFAAFLFILFLIVGVIGGWVARDYMMNYQEVEKIHPEMYDRNGNIVPVSYTHLTLPTKRSV